MSTINMEAMVDTINWVLTIGAAGVLVLRVSGKDQRRTPLWWDDHIMFVSWILLLALTITSAVAAHMRNDSAGNLATAADDDAGADPTQLTVASFSLAEAIASTISIAVASLSKTGFATTLVYTTSSTRGWPRTLAWATIIVVNITAGMTGLMLWLQCMPMRKTFEMVAYGYCWADGVVTATQVVNSSVSGLADIALALTAVYIVYEKTSRPAYRFGAWVGATLGISAAIASFTKAVFAYVEADSGSSYISGIIMILGVVEPTLIIIAGSFAELRDLLWKQPTPPVRYYDEGLKNCKRNAILHQEDFDYVLQQYMEAGRKTFAFQSPSRRASMEADSLSRLSTTTSRAAEPTWWV